MNRLAGIVRCSVRLRQRSIPRSIARQWQSSWSTSQQKQPSLMRTSHALGLGATLLAASFLGAQVYGRNAEARGRLKAISESQSSKTLPKHDYASQEHMERGIAELRKLLGEDGITTDDEELHRHGFSDWSTLNSDRLPVAVAYPKSTEDVSKIAKVCSRWRIPMVPFSGGSSLEANFSAPFGGVSIDFAYMGEYYIPFAVAFDFLVPVCFFPVQASTPLSGVLHESIEKGRASKAD